MPESAFITGLSEAEKDFLNALLALMPDDLAVWVDRVFVGLPRKPLPPLPDTDAFSVFSYTYTLILNYAPEHAPLLVRLLFRKLANAEPNPSHANALFDLINALQLIKPYSCTEQLSTLVSDPSSPYRYLWTSAPRRANLHIQLIGLYSSLYERDQKLLSQPDPFLAYLDSQIGNHPARGPFIEVSLRHCIQKAPGHFFEFSNRLVNYYHTLDVVSNWTRTFELFLNQRIQDTYQLYKWFRMLRKAKYQQAELDFQQWQDALRLQLSRSIEHRNFYRNNPYVVLLYAELIAGLKPPLATVLAQLCDLDPVPTYESFENELLQTTHRLISESVSTFGAFSDATFPLLGFRSEFIPQKQISLYIEDTDLVIFTHYDLSDDTRFAPRFLESVEQVAYATNKPRFEGLKTVCDEFANGPNEDLVHQRQESEFNSL